MKALTLLVAVGALLASLAVTEACGVDTDCEVDGGTYRVSTPAGTPRGAILYFHGWQGSAAGVMRNGALLRGARERGLLLIAPDGLGKTWSYPGSPRQLRDEFAFLDMLMADVEARFDVDRSDTLVTGFSMGGSMAWNVACHAGEGFLAFAPVAGAYWDPIPERCPSPVPRLRHIHGTADGTVPMAGRAIGDGWRQSDVYDSLNQWIDQGDCAEADPAPEPGFETRRWVCGNGGVLSLNLHGGGHAIRAEWVGEGWDWAMAEAAR